MADYFPDSEPIDHGLLPVGDGHSVYWETVGSDSGLPVLYCHGGPGSGAPPRSRRYFDPERYRAVLFDQRGCGRSVPTADEPTPDVLAANTTDHLIADIEALRSHLGIDRWAGVLGFSWGSTLALAYALAHRDRVGGIVVGLVTTTSRREVDWVTEGVGRHFPDQWHRFRSAVSENVAHLRLVDAYAEMLADPDPSVRERAAREWCAWEDAHVSMTPGASPNPRYDDPVFRYRFARLVTHYWRNDGFLADDHILNDVHHLDGTPGVLIHGRYDISSPLQTAWELDQRWATSRLQVLDDTGHGASVSLPGAVVAALAEVTDG